MVKSNRGTNNPEKKYEEKKLADTGTVLYAEYEDTKGQTVEEKYAGEEKGVCDRLF